MKLITAKKYKEFVDLIKRLEYARACEAKRSKRKKEDGDKAISSGG